MFMNIDLRIFWKLIYLISIYVYLDVFLSFLNIYFKCSVNKNNEKNY